MNPDELKTIYDAFAAHIEKGDEQAARQLLIENIPNFPKELQDQILFGLFEEEVLRVAEEGKTLAAMQQHGLQNLEQLRQMQNKIKDQLKIIQVERTLDQHP